MHARTRCAVALLGVALAVGACGGGGKGNPDGGTGGSSIGGNVGSGGATGGGGGSLGSGTACLDQPGALARPPSGRLPCDLIPPGLHL
jgi:hypothetical protein